MQDGWGSQKHTLEVILILYNHRNHTIQEEAQFFMHPASFF